MALFIHTTRPLSTLINAALLIPAILVVSCTKVDATAPGSAAEDARAIAAVEAVQQRLPPVDFVTQQPIPVSGGEPCAFNFSASARPPVFRFGPDVGRVMIDGNAKGFAADHGSVEVYPGVRQQYDGKEYSLQIQLDAADPDNRGNAQHWPAKLTMSDRYERPVFLAMGMVTCGQQATGPVAANQPAPGSDRSR